MELVDRTYQRGEITMALTDITGPPGRTFVLVHGIGMGRIVFTEVARILAKHGTVLVPDLPGFGDSPEPGTAATLEETAQIVARFVEDEARGAVTLVGHSMGTQIVAEIAYQRPELLDSLILIAPTVNRYERSAFKQGARMIQDLTGESPKVLFKGVIEYVKTSPVWFANKLKFMLQHHLEDICPMIAVPTLVLRGETDRVCPRKWVSEVAELFPDAKMEEITERGHEAIIKSPEPVATMIIDFLSARGVAHD